MVEVVGLQAHLTVPSRYHTGLVDMWIAIERSGAAEEPWLAEFHELGREAAAQLSPSGAFLYVPMAARHGWIVANAVDPRRIPKNDVEGLVRRIVSAVNARTSQPFNASDIAVPIPSWRERSRDAARASLRLFGAWRQNSGGQADVAEDASTI